MVNCENLNLYGLRVLDGGLATELERAGCDLSGPLWSAEVLRTAPERVKAVHAAFLEAGADCIMTASYQVSALGFRELGLSDEESSEALRSAVRLAAEARREYQQAHPRPVWVAASLGPYGAALHDGSEYHGRYDLPSRDLVAFHRERILVLAETGADFLAFETIPSLREAQAVAEALRGSRLAAAISFQCRDAVYVAHGEPLAECARFVANEPQVVAVGVNCTAPTLIQPLIRVLKDSSSKRIAVCPNSGEHWNPGTRSWSGRNEPADFGALAQSWRLAGADWIGGCCRTGPAHVRAVRDALERDAPAAAPMRQ